MRRSVAVIVAAVALLPGLAWAASELPEFRMQVSRSTAVAGDEIVVSVSPVDDANLYGYPLDHLVGVFEIDDLDGNLRPSGDVEYGMIEMRTHPNGGLTGSFHPTGVGEYAMVPYPEEVGELPAGALYPKPVPITVEPVGSDYEASGRPIGLILIALFVLAVGIPIAVTRLGRRWESEVDDYYERDYRDPPTMGGGAWPNGGGGGWA